MEYALDKTYKNTVVRITELVGVDGILDSFLFEGCQINGPAIIVTERGEIARNKLGPDADSILWEIALNRQRVSGVILARDCIFDGCTFVNVGFAGPAEFIKRMGGKPRT